LRGILAEMEADVAVLPRGCRRNAETKTHFTLMLLLLCVVCRVVFEAEASGGGVRQVVSPTLLFPLSLPSPSTPPLSFQTNQWEGRSDPVRGEVPRLHPYKYDPGRVAEKNLSATSFESHSHGSVE